MKTNPTTQQAINHPHGLPSDEVLRMLDSSPQDLSADEARGQWSEIEDEKAIFRCLAAKGKSRSPNDN